MMARSLGSRSLVGNTAMDTISNMITHIKNAGDAGQGEVVIPFSKLKLSIAEVLKKEGFIKDVELVTKKGNKALSVTLLMDKRTPRIKGVSRVSKLSKRVYQKADEIR